MVPPPTFPMFRAPLSIVWSLPLLRYLDKRDRYKNIQMVCKYILLVVKDNFDDRKELKTITKIISSLMSIYKCNFIYIFKTILFL